METLRGVLLVAAVLACGLLVIATPTGYVKRSPSRALMYTGYFTGGRGVDPHRQYLAKTEEDEAPNPHSRGDTGTDADHDQVTEEAEHHQVQEEKKRPKSPKRQHDDEDEDEDEHSRGAAPSFNAYFPLMFGGGWPRMGGGKKNSGGGWGMMSGGEEGGQMPGVATAIANSFSTGRGAVASSHAVAYGTPHHKRTSSGTKPKTDW